MKKFFVSAFALVLAFSSCKRTDDSALPVGYNFMATLDLSSIEIDTEPMGGGLKVSTPDDLYGIQITKNGGGLVAKGLFTSTQIAAFKAATADEDKLQVELEHNVEYTIEATMVKYGQNVRKDGSNYMQPFASYDGSDYVSNPLTENVDDWEVKNLDEEPLPFIEMGHVTGKTLEKQVNICEQKRWYYNKNYTANYNNPNINIEMKRTSFQIEYSAINIASNLNVHIEIGLGKEYTEPTTYYGFYDDQYNAHYEMDANSEGKCKFSKIYSVHNPYGSFFNDDVEYEYFVRFYIYSGDNPKDGKVVKTCEKYFGVKRNTKYVINLDANTKADHNISITADEAWIDEPINFNADEVEEKI